MLATIETIPVSHQPEITTLLGSQKSAGTTGQPSAGRALRDFGRFAGRLLMFSSTLLCLLSGYLAFNHYWFQTRWTKAEATALSGEIRELSTVSTGGTRSAGHFSSSYFFHCTVSYSVAGETRQSQLDSPASPYRLDAQVWAASRSPGEHIVIRYESSNPSRILLDYNPSEITAMESLRGAFYLFFPGILLMRASRAERPDARESDILC